MSYHYPQHVGKIARATPTSSQRVSQLVSRYPALTEEEVREIVTFLRTGRHLDVGLLTADESIGPKLDAFMQDHKSDFRIKWWEGAAVTGGIAVLLVTLWLIWETLS
jgi:hypothetical protein